MAKNKAFWAFAVSAALVTLAASGAVTSASSAGAAPQLDTWRGWHAFNGLTVMSPNSALTVGNASSSSGFSVAFSQRWNGTDWTYKPPNPHFGGSLTNVDSLSATDAWAVGFDSRGQPLTEHWDGRRWREIDAGTVQPFETIDLFDVAMVTSDNVWAVGYRIYGEGNPSPMVMHWDGSTWTRLAAPFAEGQLSSIAAVSADDIWAAGSYGMWHWDGTTWSNFSSPVGGYLRVSAASTSDVWVISGSGGPHSMAHWDGQTWTAVDSPELGRYGGRIWAVTALSKNDVWAVGNTYTDQINGRPDRAAIEHWTASSGRSCLVRTRGRPMTCSPPSTPAHRTTSGRSVPLALTPPESADTDSCSTGTARNGPGTTPDTRS